MKTINTSQHIVIPKKCETGLKSQELVDNLNSVSTEDIKTIWGELEIWVKENNDRKEKLKQQNLEDFQKNEEKRKKAKEDEEIERFETLSNTPEGLKQLHKEIDKKICMRIYDTVKGVKWKVDEISYELQKLLETKNNIRPNNFFSALSTDEDWKVYFYVHSNYWTDYPSWVRWKYIIWINVKYDENTDLYEVPAPNCLDDSNIDWDSDRPLRDWPVSVLHSYSDSYVDSGNRSKELLQEKMKLLDNNIFYENN